MSESKYMVIINDRKVAENMDLKTATILIQSLFNEYYNDHKMVISITEMPRTEGNTPAMDTVSAELADEESADPNRCFASTYM